MARAIQHGSKVPSELRHWAGSEGALQVDTRSVHEAVASLDPEDTKLAAAIWVREFPIAGVPAACMTRAARDKLKRMDQQRKAEAQQSGGGTQRGDL